MVYQNWRVENTPVAVLNPVEAAEDLAGLNPREFLGSEEFCNGALRERVV